MFAKHMEATVSRFLVHSLVQTTYTGIVQNNILSILVAAIWELWLCPHELLKHSISVHIIKFINCNEGCKHLDVSSVVLEP
jgi:hypothetical protein